MEVQVHSFLTSALHRVSGNLHITAALPSRKEPPAPLEYESGWTPQPVWNFLEARQVSFYVMLFTPCIFLYSVLYPTDCTDQNAVKHTTQHTSYEVPTAACLGHQIVILRELNNNMGKSVQHVLEVLVALTFRVDTVHPATRCVVRSAG